MNDTVQDEFHASGEQVDDFGEVDLEDPNYVPEEGEYEDGGEVEEEDGVLTSDTEDIAVLRQEALRDLGKKPWFITHQ